MPFNFEEYSKKLPNLKSNSESRPKQLSINSTSRDSYAYKRMLQLDKRNTQLEEPSFNEMDGENVTVFDIVHRGRQKHKEMEEKRKKAG